MAELIYRKMGRPDYMYELHKLTKRSGHYGVELDEIEILNELTRKFSLWK